MHSRCKPEYKQAADYFHRGVRVCERWDSYEFFLADMGERPDGMTLDRRDNDGNYEPANCRWANSSTQRRNSRRVIFIILDGAELPLKDAASKLGITDSAIHQERTRNGGSYQEAFDRVHVRRRTLA